MRGDAIQLFLLMYKVNNSHGIFYPIKSNFMFNKMLTSHWILPRFSQNIILQPSVSESCDLVFAVYRTGTPCIKDALVTNILITVSLLWFFLDNTRKVGITPSRERIVQIVKLLSSTTQDHNPLFTLTPRRFIHCNHVRRSTKFFVLAGKITRPGVCTKVKSVLIN